MTLSTAAAQSMSGSVDIFGSCSRDTFRHSMSNEGITAIDDENRNAGTEGWHFQAGQNKLGIVYHWHRSVESLHFWTLVSPITSEHKLMGAYNVVVNIHASDWPTVQEFYGTGLNLDTGSDWAVGPNGSVGGLLPGFPKDMSAEAKMLDRMQHRIKIIFQNSAPHIERMPAFAKLPEVHEAIFEAFRRGCLGLGLKTLTRPSSQAS